MIEDLGLEEELERQVPFDQYVRVCGVVSCSYMYDNGVVTPLCDEMSCTQTVETSIM